MKNDSPNKFSFLGATGQAMAAKQAQAAQAQQAAGGGLAGAIGSSLGGSLLSGNTNLASDLGAATMDQANPFDGKTFQITPANMMGNAKPVFNESTSDAAAMMYGSSLERQMSMPKAGTSAMALKDIPKGDDGKGLRALDDSVVEQMGYDSATKMVSPLGLHKPGHVEPRGPRNSVGAVMIGKEIPKKMSKTLTDKPKVTTAYNSSYTGNPDVSNRVYNAATGLSINEDPTYNYKKASQYEANAIQQYGSLEAARKALYNKRNK